MPRRIAFLFPGQGAQFVGMGRDLFEESEAGKTLIALASETAGADLKTLCLKGPARVLEETEFLQPALTALSLALDAELKMRGIAPFAVAGHSLGELPALASSGKAEPEAVIGLAAARGRLMALAASKAPGTMAAVTGLSPEIVRPVVETLAKRGIIGIAAYNAPSQLTVSGRAEMVDELRRELLAISGARVTPLSVSGAWHSELMEPAVFPFLQALHDVRFRESRVPLFFNRHGEQAEQPAEIRELLSAQLVSPVRWDRVMARLVAFGVTDFAEVGPGRVLSGLVRLNCPDPQIAVHSVADLRSLDRVASLLSDEA